MDRLSEPYQPWAGPGVVVDEPMFLVKDQVALELAAGTTHRIDIPRSGDWLAGGVLLLHLPALPDAPVGGVWSPKIGYRVFQRIRLVIDDVIVADHERLWYDLHDQALDSRVLSPGIGLSTRRAHTVYVPLRLGIGSTSYARHGVNSLPLRQLAVQSKVQLHIVTSASFDDLAAGAPKAIPATVLFDYYLTEPAAPVPAVVYTTVRDADNRPGSNAVSLNRLNGPVTGLVFASYEPGTNFVYADETGDAFKLLFGPDVILDTGVDACYTLNKMYTTGSLTTTDVRASNVGYVELASPWVDFARVKNPTAVFGQPGKTHRVFALVVQYLAFGAGTVRLGFL